MLQQDAILMLQVFTDFKKTTRKFNFRSTEKLGIFAQKYIHGSDKMLRKADVRHLLRC